MESLDLEGLPLFRGLLTGEIERFLSATGARVESYRKGDMVLDGLSRNSLIGVMVEGAAQIVSVDRSGNEVVGHKLMRGMMVGATSAILPQVDDSASVEALSEVQVLWVPYIALLTAGTKLGRVHGIVMKNILEALAMKNVLMLDKLELLSQRTLRDRLIVYLLQRERHEGHTRVRVPGRVQMAKELECNRSALTREIASMREAGVLLSVEDWMELDKTRI